MVGVDFGTFIIQSEVHQWRRHHGVIGSSGWESNGSVVPLCWKQIKIDDTILHLLWEHNHCTAIAIVTIVAIASHIQEVNPGIFRYDDVCWFGSIWLVWVYTSSVLQPPRGTLVLRWFSYVVNCSCVQLVFFFALLNNVFFYQNH